MTNFPESDGTLFAVYYLNMSLPDDDGIIVLAVFPSEELARDEAEFLSRHNRNPETFYGWQETHYLPRKVER